MGSVSELEECRRICHDLLGEVLLLRQKLEDLTTFAENEVAEKVVLQDELADLRSKSRRRAISFLRRSSRSKYRRRVS